MNEAYVHIMMKEGVIASQLHSVELVLSETKGGNSTV